MIHQFSNPFFKVKNFLKYKLSFCKIFGHKWIYSMTNLNQKMEIRVCKHCHRAQTWCDMGGNKFWSFTNQRTKLGVEMSVERGLFTI